MQTYFESEPVPDTTTFQWKIDGNEGDVKSESDPVATHNLGLSAPQKIFKYISVNPSLSLKHVWVDKTFNATLDPATNLLVTTEKQGFETRTTGSLRVSFRTQIYGMFPIKLGALKGVRHVASPSIGYSYTPDFSEPLFGYDFGYFETFKRSSGEILLHDRFKGTRAGSTPKSKSQSMSLSLNNVFQAKVGEDKEEKKIDLFSWKMSTSYNFVADSMNLANLRSSIRTKLGKKLNLDLSMTHDFYQLKPYEQISGNDTIIDFERVNELNRLPRLINARISTRFRFSGNIMSSRKQRDEETETDTLEIDELNLDLFQEKEEPVFSSDNTGKLWSTSLNLSYSLNKSNPLKEKETFWINTNTDIQVTPNWKVKYSARFDVLEKELVSQSFSVYRNLHCWELSLNWTPSGFGQGVYLKINEKSPTLRDIKIEQKSGLYGRRAF